MATNEELVKIIFQTDTSGAEAGAKKLSSSFTEINQAAELVMKGFRLVNAAGQELFDILDQGQAFANITASFEALQTKSGQLADVQLKNLRSETQGLISDMQLMQQANNAVVLGLPQDEYAALAGAAVKLGAAVGQTATQAIESLTTGIGRQSKLMLDNLGIIIDTAGANEKFAAANHKTAESLTDAEQKLAFYQEALLLVKDAAKDVGDIQITAGLAAQQLANASENAFNQFALGVTESESLAKILTSLSGVIENIDFQSLGRGVGEFAGQVINAIPGVQALQANLRQIAELRQTMSTTGRGLFETIGDSFSAVFGGEEGKARSQAQLLTNILSTTTKDAANAIAGAFSGAGVAGAGGGAGGGGAGGKSVADAIQKAIDKAEAFKDSVSDRSLQSALTNAVATLNEADFNELLEELKDGTAQGLLKGHEEFLKTAPADQRDAFLRAMDQSVELTASSWVDKFSDASEAAAEKMRADQEKAFQQSADFFQDLLFDLFSGEAFDFELAGKKLLTGVLSGGLAELTSGLGINFGSIGSVAGLGQQLGSSILGGAGVGGLGSLFGGGAAAAGAVEFAPGAAPALGGGLSAGVLGPLAAVGLFGAKGVQDLSAGKSSVFSGGTLGTLALGGIGGTLGGIAGALGFGGGTKDKDQSSRDSLRAILQESGLVDDNFILQGFGKNQFDIGREEFRGGQSFDVIDTPFSGDATALANPLATLLTGGESDKLQNDLAGFFTNLSVDAENFNEVLLNSQVILSNMGLSAEEAKGGLLDLFFEGKIALDELTSGVEQLNILGQDNLIGTGSISDALELFAKNIDEDPKAALKAFELLLVEAGEVGITSMTELGAYITENFGPDVSAVFQQIQAIGIPNLEALQAAGVDQIVALFGAFEQFGDDTISVFANSSDQAASAMTGNLSRINGALEETKRKAGETAEALNDVVRAGGNAAGQDFEENNNQANV